MRKSGIEFKRLEKKLSERAMERFEDRRAGTGCTSASAQLPRDRYPDRSSQTSRSLRSCSDRSSQTSRSLRSCDCAQGRLWLDAFTEFLKRVMLHPASREFAGTGSRDV
jgi:hypothetical protein